MDFCWRSYILRYPDLKKAGINNYDKAIEHWKMYGKNEGRNGCKIDTKKYSLLEEAIDEIGRMLGGWLRSTVNK